LVTYQDARDLAIQLTRVLTQPTFERDLGKGAFKRAKERLSLDVQGEAITTLYESTIYASR
jgi:hypothetical protein